MRHKVNKSVEIMLDGKRCLLEKGDEITVHTEPSTNVAPTSVDDYMNQIASHMSVAQEEINNKVEVEAEVSQQTLIEEVNKIIKSDVEKDVIEEAAVHRRYLEIKNGEECNYYSPASANDNYMLYFIDRLFKSRKFNNKKYKSKIIRKIPAGNKKKSLETFLKILMPVPEKKS